MIDPRFQPRIETTLERTRVTIPPRRPLGYWFALAFVSIYTLIGAGIFWFTFEKHEHGGKATTPRAIGGGFAVVGILFTLVVIRDGRKVLHFEATPEELLYTCRGLFFQSRRRWPARSIVSIAWQPTGWTFAETDVPVYVLVARFADGDSRRFIKDGPDRNLGSAAWALSKALRLSYAAPFTESATGPMDAPTGVPDSIRFERTADGALITLAPLPRLRRSAWRVLMGIAGSLLLIGILTLPYVVFRTYGEESLAKGSLLLTLFGVFVGVAIVSTEFNRNRDGVQFVLRGKTLVFNRKGGIPDRHWDISDLHHARVDSLKDEGRIWEMELIFRSSPSFKLLRGRSYGELIWLAGLLRAARGNPATMEKVVVADRKGGTCLVCGSALERAVVLCSKCRTAHHEECWVYNGACSTYGCREIRYEKRS